MQSQRFIFAFFVRMGMGLLLPCLIGIGLFTLAGHGTPRRVIAFVTTADYNPRLHVMDVQRRIVRRVSKIPVYSCCPKWSPDGTAIAFNGSDEQNYVVDIYAGNTHRLTPPDWSGWVMGWSADGQQIILRTTGASNSGLYQIDSNGENFALLAEGAKDRIYLPQLSPDSRFAFYAQRQPNAVDWKIYRLNLEDGTGRPFITESYTGAEALAFSPDGGRAAYALNQRREVILMNADGSHLQRLKTVEDILEMVWSPDSQQILFLERDAAGIPDVYVSDADGQNPRDLGIKGALPFLSDLSWSPDGAQIVFLSESVKDKLDLYVMDADGKNLQRLTSNSENNIYPAWQPGA
jgi:TolB protein